MAGALTTGRAFTVASAADRVIFIGVDLGKMECHSAIVVVERVEEYSSSLYDVLRNRSLRKRYVIRQVERLALGVAYRDVVVRVKQVVTQLSVMGTCVLVVDESGVGAPVVEAMREAGLGTGGVSGRLYPMIITSGQHSTDRSVPRTELITKMKLMVERGELELAAGCLHGEWLKQELVQLRLDGTAGKDDLAMALALACWKARVR